MFVWTPERVLCAIDAGIVEVINTYNSVFTFYMRKPKVHPATAYRRAMEETIVWLEETEQAILAATVVKDALSDLTFAVAEREYAEAQGFTFAY